jgi:hypothetical protein
MLDTKTRGKETAGSFAVQDMVSNDLQSLIFLAMKLCDPSGTSIS